MSEGIRSATTADRDALVALSRRTISAAYRAFLGDEAVDAYLEGGEVEAYVDGHLDATDVLVRDGAVVALVVFDGRKVDLLLVDAELRGTGLGGTLLRHAEERLVREHDHGLVECFAGNEPALAFYRKNGWREERRFVDERAEAEVVELWKPLRQSAWGSQHGRPGWRPVGNRETLHRSAGTAMGMFLLWLAIVFLIELRAEGEQEVGLVVALLLVLGATLVSWLLFVAMHGLSLVVFRESHRVWLPLRWNMVPRNGYEWRCCGRSLVQLVATIALVGWLLKRWLL